MRREIDSSVIERARQGDEFALTDVFEFYFKRILNYCKAEIGSLMDVEDVALEVMNVFMSSRLSRFEIGRPVFPYLVKIAHGRCVDRLRKSERDSYKIEFLPMLTEDEAEKYPGIGEDEI